MTREALHPQAAEIPALSEAGRTEVLGWIAKFESSGDPTDTIRALILKTLLESGSTPVTLWDLSNAISWSLANTALRDRNAAFPYGAVKNLIVSLNNLMKAGLVYVASVAEERNIPEIWHPYTLKERTTGEEPVQDEAA